MRQTLFTIDHFLFENHWILIAWLVLGAIYLGVQMLRGKTSDAWSLLPVYVVGAVLILFVFPRLETPGINVSDPNGPLVPDGLAIRGYGLCLLLAMTTGFGLVLFRCHQIGLDGDKMLSLCFWMVVVGLVGARLFYVIQKFDNFSDVEPSKLLLKMLDMTSGGLVVYGSLIGGMVAVVVFLYVQKLPWRTVVDVLAPGMIIGLAIGRIGCLMNGCCFGGVCDAELPGIFFPAGSAPYVEQLRSGELLGVDGSLDKETGLVTVNNVLDDSVAKKSGVKVGDQIRVYLTHKQADDPMLRLRAAKNGVDEMQVNAVIDFDEGPAVFIPPDQLPSYSLKTHPTQIYSAINAALLCAFLWFYFPYRRNTGEVFAWLVILYPIGRFVLEIIRQDELGQFGTGFTISQLVSFGVLAAGIALMAFTRIVPQLPEDVENFSEVDEK